MICTDDDSSLLLHNFSSAVQRWTMTSSNNGNTGERDVVNLASAPKRKDSSVDYTNTETKRLFLGGKYGVAKLGGTLVVPHIARLSI
jgi:hypothetical protein